MPRTSRVAILKRKIAAIRGRGSYARFRKKASYSRFKRATPYRRTYSYKPRTTSRGRFYGRGSYGYKIGSALGGMLGDFAETGIRSLLGYGSYTVKQNAIWNSMRGNDPPKMFNSGVNGDLVVRHREYLQDVITAATPNTFKLTSYSLNPGLFSSFPWLAPIAAQFEQYEFEGIVFEYKTMSSDALNSTNTALGTVIMATEYNSINPPFQSKQEMENHEFATSCKPSISAMHPVECARSQTSLNLAYVRSGPVPANADQRMYDLGNFQIATSGFQGTSVNIGELWVTYQIRFKKPCSNTIVGGTVLSDHFICSGTIASATPLGTTTSTPVSGSGLGCTVTSGHTLNFPSIIQTGVFMIQYMMTGSATAVVYNGMGGLVNCTQLQYFINDTFNTASTTGVTSDIFFVTTLVKLTGPNASVRMNAGWTLCSSPVGADLWVTPVDADISS